MKTALSVGIGAALVLGAVPLGVFAHDTDTPHPHPGMVASSTRPASAQPKPAIKKALEVTKEIEQRHPLASTTGARPILKNEMEQKRLMMGATSTRPVFREDMEQKRLQMKESLETRREKFESEGIKRAEALKKKFGEERAARIEAYFKKMLEKFDAAISRQQTFADKLSAFLDKAEANGKDVTTLRAKLATAEEALLAAESALEDAKTKYAEAAANTDFTARFAAVRTLIEGVAEKIKASHRALIDVLTSIKGLNIGRHDERATTTSP